MIRLAVSLDTWPRSNKYDQAEADAGDKLLLMSHFKSSANYQKSLMVHDNFYLVHASVSGILSFCCRRFMCISIFKMAEVLSCSSFGEAGSL